MQKYWSGTVTRNTVMRRAADYLHLNKPNLAALNYTAAVQCSENLLYIADVVRCFFNCAQKTFWGAHAEILLLCARAEILPFLGFVQKYYCPGTKPSWEPVQGHFWARAEILVSRRNIHLCPEAITDDIFPKS